MTPVLGGTLSVDRRGSPAEPWSRLGQPWSPQRVVEPANGRRGATGPLLPGGSSDGRSESVSRSIHVIRSRCPRQSSTKAMTEQPTATKTRSQRNAPEPRLPSTSSSQSITPNLRIPSFSWQTGHSLGIRVRGRNLGGLHGLLVRPAPKRGWSCERRVAGTAASTVCRTRSAGQRRRRVPRKSPG